MITPGKRLPDKTSAVEMMDAEPGSYSISESRKVFLARIPDGTFIRLDIEEGDSSVAGVWGMIEHSAVERSQTIAASKLITIIPSINVHAHDDYSGWHGFLQRGVWKDA